MMYVLLALATLLLSYANGANDNFKAVATIYGSSTLSYRRALALATVAQILGSIASVVLAGALLAKFTGQGLVGPETLGDGRFIVAVALGAGATVLLATRIGLPISTTHSIIGGLVGAGVALSPNGVAWASLGAVFLLPLLISPFLAFAIAATLYPMARHVRRRLGIDEVTCLCVGKEVAPVAITSDGALVVTKTGLSLTVEQAQNCQRRYSGSVLGISAQGAIDSLHLTSGLSLGFARGLNDTPKIMALLLASGSIGVNPSLGLVVVAVMMALGGILHSRRMAITLGQRITEMNRGQGFVANIVASALVIGATLLGSPVSTTHVATGSIFGIGLWTRRAHWGVVGQIVAAWIVTLPMAALLASLAAITLRRSSAVSLKT